MCEQLLANPLIESYEIELAEAPTWQPTARASGRSSSPARTTTATRAGRSRALGADAVLVWHADDRPAGLDAVVLPGGFSYGDYLRCGAIARFAPAMEAVASSPRPAASCSGSATASRSSARRACCPACCGRTSRCRSSAATSGPVERTDTPFTSRCEEGQTLTIPVKHGEGSWFADDDLLAELEARAPDRPALRGDDRTVRRDDVAGVVNEVGNVMGLMPHPEHAVDPLLGSADGALILSSLVESARERTLAV